MDFKDTLEYMYDLLPMYQRVGKSAFKKDLTNTIKLCKSLGNPHEKFKSIHVAGTNGKGSSAHMMASILQSAGYKTGLYTSPHLVSFTERIKVNGEEVDEQFVCDFIERFQEDIHIIQPSFFEITVAMAFDYFERQSVDIAVVEVGLGGRFDSTNVLTPLISLITTIGYDHTDMLGKTLPEIAFEKAGIIKKHVPVVISETQDEIIKVFKSKAAKMNAPIFFADQEYNVAVDLERSDHLNFVSISKGRTFRTGTDLNGLYQLKNIPGVMKVMELLSDDGFDISQENLNDGFENVVKNTGLFGRWQKLYDRPLTICDTAHNEAAVKLMLEQIAKISFKDLHVIWGAVEGKNLDVVFSQMPNDAFYYFCEASVPRALPAEKLKLVAESNGCQGDVIRDVNEAIIAARNKAGEHDLVVIGGSNFIISEIKNLIQ